jgi:hypothetical protein
MVDGDTFPAPGDFQRDYMILSNSYMAADRYINNQSCQDRFCFLLWSRGFALILFNNEEGCLKTTLPGLFEAAPSVFK